MSDQQAIGPFTKRVDELYPKFHAIANEYQTLHQNLLKNNPTETLYKLFPPASAPISSAVDVLNAISILTKAIPSLEQTKTLLTTFSLQAKSFREEFELLAKDGNLEQKSSLVQLLDDRNRERFVKLFGSFVVVMMCADDINGKLRDVEWFLERARSDNVGSGVWTRSFTGPRPFGGPARGS